ncbi:MAG: hypothetical protein H6606_09090 [Flavobacteriales bacterium]|nr:hypothetical protein [Flavobacteriales bacterium]
MAFGQSQRPANYPANGTWPITIKFQKTDHVNGSCSSEIIEHEFSSSAQYSIQYTQPLYWRLHKRLADGSSITVTFYNRNNQFLVRRNRIDVAISAAPNASCPTRTNSGTEHYNSVNNPDFPRSNTPSVFDLTTMSLSRAFSGISCSCFPSTLSVATPPLSCTATSEKPQCGEKYSGVVEVKVQGGNKSLPYNYSWNSGGASGGTAQSITG